MHKLMIATLLMIFAAPTLKAENAWRYWVGGASDLGEDGTWSRDSLSWSTSSVGGGTLVSQWKDKLQFKNGPRQISVVGTNEIHGTFYLISDGFVFTGGTISGPFGPSLYPKTTTVINSVLDIPGSFKVSMPTEVDRVPVNLTNEFENARLVINSDLTMKDRIILYHGTLILNGDLTTVSTIGSYSGTEAFFGHLQVNGTQTGCTGYVTGRWSRLSGTGRMELASANAEVKIYGRLTPGTDEAPGTLTVKTGKVRFLEGAKMVLRVDLDADKADKLVCENGSWLISNTDQGAEIEIRISGKLKETRTYQLYEYDAGYKKNTFVPRIVRAPGCTALATFDETTGLLTVKPSGLMLILR